MPLPFGNGIIAYRPVVATPTNPFQLVIEKRFGTGITTLFNVFLLNYTKSSPMTMGVFGFIILASQDYFNTSCQKYQGLSAKEIKKGLRSLVLSNSPFVDPPAIQKKLRRSGVFYFPVIICGDS